MTYAEACLGASVRLGSRPKTGRGLGGELNPRSSMMTSVKLARTGAVDPKTGRVYLPTREAWSRPTPKPGTFVVLVLDR